MTGRQGPARRRHWVKRTSAPSALIPDLSGAIQELIATVAGDVLRHGLHDWLKKNQLPEQANAIVGVIDTAFQRAIRQDLQERERAYKVAAKVLRDQARDHAERLFDRTFDHLPDVLGDKYKSALPTLVRLKPALRREFLERIDQAGDRVRESFQLTIPAGTPVNLYANLSQAAMANAVVAHVRYRDDPRALAEALLRMSDCPDLVEDKGHTYGSELLDEDKEALIEFLKTF